MPNKLTESALSKLPYVTRQYMAEARKFTFSAATLIQNEPTTAEEWSTIADDLDRAKELAETVADQLYKAENGE